MNLKKISQIAYIVLSLNRFKIQINTNYYDKKSCVKSRNLNE